MQGRIHSFQSLGTVDGPGVRSVVFMQGCPLRCPYCHNPDSWDTSSGTPVDTDELVERILRYRGYYGENGGVTVSGGEPLLQAEFVCELFLRLREQAIGCCLDTSGCIVSDAAERAIAASDIVLLDIKLSTDELYKKYIGIPLSLPLETLKLCERLGKRVRVRQVVTPGINDSLTDVSALSELLKPYRSVERVELLPFRTLCREKYKSLGIDFPFGKYADMDADKLNALRKKVFPKETETAETENI